MNRQKVIAVKVTETEEETIKKKAEEKGLKTATYLRLKGLEQYGLDNFKVLQTFIQNSAKW